MDPAEKPKRRLPVLKNEDVADEADLERPPWHWSAIGAVAIFVLWWPLTFLTGALDQPMLGDVAAAAVNLLGFVLAAFGGGAIVGRFGGKAGLKEATVAGVAPAVILCVMVALQGTPLGLSAVLLVVLVAAGAGASRAGGWLGLRKRLNP